jgi:hypothetical protein
MMLTWYLESENDRHNISGSSGLSVLFKQECGHTSFFMVRPINS